MNYSNNEKRQIVKNDYDAIAESFSKNYDNIEYCKEYVQEFVKNLNGKSVLDVGCGAGDFTNYLHKLGIQAKGIDFSNKMLSIARKKYPDIEFENADICEYKTTNLYDGIFTKDMLFHLADEDIVKTLRKFKKMLKPDGRICIILEMPQKAGEQILVEELDQNYKIYYNYLTPQKLKNLLEQENITINDIKIVEENAYAFYYATGLMVFQACNKKP